MIVSLAACGGGGGSSPPVPPGPPPAPVAPVIQAQPASISTTAGSPATFSVVSPNAASFRWQRSQDGGATWNDVAGAADDSLTISATALLDSGARYRVVLGNAAGSATSDMAVLTVRPNLRLLAGALGGSGYLDGRGVAARFELVRGAVVDAAGNLLVTDRHMIRRITPAGEVTTFLGMAGEAGRIDGPPTVARLSLPVALAFDASGSLWFIDQGTCYLRKFADGVVTSVASLATPSGGCYQQSYGLRDAEPNDLAIGPNGDIFVSDRMRNAVLRVDAAADVTIYAGSVWEDGAADGSRLEARFWMPRGLVFDAAGNLYVADSQNCTIRRIDPDGMVTTLVGVAGQRDHVDGTGAAARLVRPVGFRRVGERTLVISESMPSTVRLLDLDTLALTTIAGAPFQAGAADGDGGNARFNLPIGVAVDTAGGLYVADYGNSMVRKLTLAGAVSTLAGQPLPAGNVDGSGPAARFGGAFPLAADAQGSVYVADWTNHVVRKVTPEGVATTLAGSAGQPGAEDGIGSAARFNRPIGLAVDAQGNVIVADSSNHRLRKITPAGVVSTVAGAAGRGFQNDAAAEARFDTPVAVSFDTAGNLYVADEQNCVIRKVSPDGVVSTLAGFGPSRCANMIGGPGVASLFWPTLVLAIGIEDVLVVDPRGLSIYRARGDGSVAYVAGSQSGLVDGGMEARFGSVSGLALDSRGNVLIADSENNAIRLMSPDFTVKTLLSAPWPVNTTLGDPPALRLPAGIAALPGGAIAVSSEAAILVD